jgi:hypothetical protein
MKATLSSLALIVLLLTSVTAHALTPAYDSTFSSVSPITLRASDFSTLSFSTANGHFTSAILDLDVTSLANSVLRIGSNTVTLPPSGEFLTDTSYLFTNNLKLGHNTLNLNNYLSTLNLANSKTGINLGLYLDRGSITFSKARLTGTVAPEPATMALVAAGLLILPFARRFRNYLR